MSAKLDVGKVSLLRLYIDCLHNISLRGTLLSTCLKRGQSMVVWLGRRHTLHHTAQCIEDCLGCEVLGRNKVDEMLLSSFFLLLQVSGLWGCGGGGGHASSLTFCRISNTVGSASSRDAESSWRVL